MNEKNSNIILHSYNFEKLIELIVLNSFKFSQILMIEYGHDSQYTDRVCNPTITFMYNNSKWSRKYGYNRNCPKTWKVDVDVNQSFESWYTSNVQYNADKYVTSFNGAVG